MDDFRLEINRLTEVRQHLCFDASPAWWAQREQEREVKDGFTPIQAPLHFELDVVRIRDDLVFEGDFGGVVEVECSRCTKRYSHALRDSFRLVLSPAADHEATDPEGARNLTVTGICLGEDLEAGWYRGPVIRLDDFFGEVIALALPLQPLCSSECPGMCSHCGVNLSVVQCDCVDEKTDSPFAVLATLKGMDDA